VVLEVCHTKRLRCISSKLVRTSIVVKIKDKDIINMGYILNRALVYFLRLQLTY